MCQFDRENRGDIFTRIVLQLTDFSPHLQVLTAHVGDHVLFQLQSGFAVVLLVCKSDILSHGPAGYIYIKFVFLTWKMGILRGSGKSWKESRADNLTRLDH